MDHVIKEVILISMNPGSYSFSDSMQKNHHRE